MTTPPRPAPVATEATRPFWEAARQHRLVIQHCTACGKPQFYPRAFCRHCLSDKLDWRECSGRGHIYTFTINHRAANAHMADKLPYAVAVVTLEEGVRMMGNVAGPLEHLRIGAAVRVRFLDLDEEYSLPQFELAQDGGSRPGD
jgi:uncharacterized OB-fold protein